MQPSKQSVVWILGLGLALLLRLIAVADRAGSATLLNQIDSQIYRNLAQSIASGAWTPAQGFFMSPLYPYWLALVSPSGSFPPALVWQSILGVLALGGLALVAGRWGGPVASGTTLLLGALASPLLLYDSAILPDGPAFALLALGLSALMLRPDDLRGLVAAGIAVALAYGLRSNLLPPILIGAGWLLWRNRDTWRSGARRALAFSAPVVVVLLTIGALNQAAEGRFVPRSFNAGQNLYIGNNPSSDGTYTPVNEIHPGDMQGRATAQARRGRALDSAEVESFWRERALDLMRENPGKTFRLFLKKLVLTLHPYDVPQMESATLAKRESAAFRIAFVQLGWVLPLAVMGGLGLTRAQRFLAVPLLGVALASIAICVVFFVNGRLRHPLWIALLPLAGVGVAHLVAIVRGAIPRRELWRLGAGLTVTLLIAAYPVHSHYRDAMSASRYATLEALGGDATAARAWMEVGSELERRDPWWPGTRSVSETFAEHPDAQWVLRLERAAAWFTLGDFRQAYADMLPAANALPQSRRAQEGLVQICERLMAAGDRSSEVRAARDRARQRLQRLGGPS